MPRNDLRGHGEAYHSECIVWPGSVSRSKGIAGLGDDLLRQGIERKEMQRNCTDGYGKGIALDGRDGRGMVWHRHAEALFARRGVETALFSVTRQWQGKAQPSASEVTKRAEKPCVAAARRGVAVICIAMEMHHIDVRRQSLAEFSVAKARQSSATRCGGMAKL